MSPIHSRNFKIAIVEANQLRRNNLKSVVSSWGYIPYCFEKESICLDNLTAISPDMAVFGTEDIEKIYRFVASTRLISNGMRLLILSNHHAPAKDFDANRFAPLKMLKNNANISEIREAIEDGIGNQTGSGRISDCPLIVGKSPDIIKINNMIPELSRFRETIFLRGEDGTGKELLAKVIFLHSERRKYPFVKIDAAAIQHTAAKDALGSGLPQADLENNLRTAGLLPDGGAATVFLDGVESLPQGLQLGLLRMLENSKGEEFGSGSPKPYDVRIIAAADKELEPLVEKGLFRKDLYYRLNVLSLAIPSLRNRREDIPLLADFFADKFCLSFGRGCFDVSARAKSILSAHHWPGNVGELEDLIRDMVVTGSEKCIHAKLGMKTKDRRTVADLLVDLVRPEIFDSSDFSKLSLKEICRNFKIRTEGELMKRALEFTDWNRKKTAKLLNISYKSLLNKIKEYGLEKEL